MAILSGESWLTHHQGQPTSSQPPSPHQRYDGDNTASTPLQFELVHGQLRCIEPVLLTEDEVDRMAVEAEEELKSRTEAKVKAQEEAKVKAKAEVKAEAKAKVDAEAQADAEVEVKGEKPDVLRWLADHPSQARPRLTMED